MTASVRKSIVNRVPCGVRDESFINPHFVIRDAGSLSGLQASRLPLLRLEVGSSKGQCRRPTCLICAGYNKAHTAAAGHLLSIEMAAPFNRGFFRKDVKGVLPKRSGPSTARKVVFPRTRRGKTDFISRLWARNSCGGHSSGRLTGRKVVFLC